MGLARLTQTLQLCESALAAGVMLGIHLTVFHDGELVANAAFGAESAGVPARVDSVGEMRCAVKPLTALVLAAAAQHGLLSLDDHLSRWVPAGTNAVIANCTLRELLTHRAGIPELRSTRVYSVDFHEYVDRLLALRIASWTWRPIGFYSLTAGWHLLGWVAEQVLGEPIIALTTRIMWPGAEDSRLLGHAEENHPFLLRHGTENWEPYVDQGKYRLYDRPNPAWGGCASVSDLVRLYVRILDCLEGQATMEGAVVPIEPATVAALIQPSMPISVTTGQPSVPFATGFFRGGTGINFADDWDSAAFGHGGTIGSRYGTGVICEPGSRTVVAYRLSSLSLRTNAFVSAVGTAVRADLGLGVADH
ncbi:serine hydrolase domain-containing protein [Fodinicola feengrottensis]|nr:serine hydrolase domain-containing protein [Fodinicola feengrottensis]